MDSDAFVIVEGRKVIVINSDIIPNNLFVLKHKDLDMG